MKKRFISAMLFGALVLAAGTSVTSCSDYDDEIQNLQTQIDQITSSNPVTADDIKAAVDAAKGDLQKQLDELEQQLAGSGDDSGLAAKVQELERKIAELDGIKNRLDELELAEKEYAETGSLAAYQAKEGLNAFINEKITDALDGNGGAIAAYIEEAVKTGALIDLNRLNAELAAIVGPAGSLTLLQADFEKYITGNGDEALLKRVSGLESYAAYIEKFIENGNGLYETFADVLDQIEETRTLAASLFVPGGEAYNAVQAIVAGEIGAVDSRIETIESDIEKLGIDVEAIKGMIQSIVYVPAYADGKVQFTTLYAEPASGSDWDLISSSQEVEVKFRISPASAVQNFVKNYEVEIQSLEVESRADEPLAVKEGSVVVADADLGIVAMKLSADNLTGNRAACLHVTGKRQEGASDFVSDVTSDYFDVVAVEKYMKNVKYETAETERELVYNAGEGEEHASLDFLAGGHYELYVSDSKTGTFGWEKASDELGIDMDLFHLTFKVSGDINYFSLDAAAGVLKVANVGQTSSVNKSVTVGYEIAVDNASGSPYSGTYDDKVTIVRRVGAANIGNFDFEWNNVGGFENSYALSADEMDAVYNAAGLTKEEFNRLAHNASVFDFADGDAYFAFVGGADNDLKLIVKQGTNGGKAVARIKVTETLSITIEAVANVAYPEVDKLAKKAEMWDGDVVYLPVAVDAAQASQVNIGFDDITRIFSNYSDVEAAVVAKAGGTIEFKPEVGEMRGNKYIVDVNDYLGSGENLAEKLKMDVVVKFGDDHVVETIPVVFKFIDDINLSGTWAVPVAGEIVIEDRYQSASLTSGTTGGEKWAFSWTDYRGSEMWPAIDKNAFGSSLAGRDALHLYGLDVEMVPVGENAGKFIVDQNAGTIKLTDDQASLESVAGDITVQVKVTATSIWGTVPNNVVTLNVRVKQWAD